MEKKADPVTSRWDKYLSAKTKSTEEIKQH